MKVRHGLAAGVLVLSTLIFWLAANQAGLAAFPSAERHVCPTGPPTCDYASIQDAVDAAGAGDVIKVATGTYSDVHTRGGSTQVVAIDKTVTIRGGYTTGDWNTFDPAGNPTTLDAQGQGRVVTIAGSASPTLQGLRMTGGDADGLGGGHWNEDAGAGLYISEATVTVQDCQVFSNTAQAGGGLFLKDSAATIVNSTITGNTAVSTPGGSYGDGGGLFLDGSDATLSGSVIRENSAQFSGSGVYLGFGSDATLVNNVIADNRIDENAPFPYDCGIYVVGSSPQFKHNTIARNSGGGDTGVCLENWGGGGSVTMTNTILVGQTTGIVAQAQFVVDLQATLWGSGARDNGTDWSGAGTIDTGSINVHADPGFVDAASGDYHITQASGAIDAGVDAGVTTDIDGEARPAGAGYDIGADELQPSEPTTTPTPTATPTATSTPTLSRLYLPTMLRIYTGPSNRTPKN